MVSEQSVPPYPRHHPVSATPLADYLGRPCPGAGEDYLVLPRSLLESMPLRWQQTLLSALRELHEAYGHLDWPIYRAVPSQWERLVDLDEDQLDTAGYLADIDPDGNLVYTDRADQPVPDPEARRVLVAVSDPIPPRSAGYVEPQALAWPGAAVDRPVPPLP